MKPSEMWRRLQYWMNRDRLTRDLEEEMRLHVQFRAESMEKGDVARPDAYANARRRFGNTTVMQERSRDTWGFPQFESVGNDLRLALRRLGQRPGFTAGVVGIMAIGIGATTAMFSAVDAVLLKPLPFLNPEQLVVLPGVRIPFARKGSSGNDRIRETDFAAVSQMRNVFSHVAAYGAGGLNLSGDEQPVRVRTGVVTADFFQTLGAQPAIGRTFLAEEGVPGGADVTVISDGLWKRQYGSQDISRIRILLNNRAYHVVGVMPAGFSFPEESDLWIPMSVPNTMLTFEAFRDFVPTTVIARIADSMTFAAASARMLLLRKSSLKSKTGKEAAAARAMLNRIRPGDVMVSLQGGFAQERRVALSVLLSATTLLLLVACANIMNLLLAHAASRRREIAMRQVLGATRSRIVRQLLTESVVLSLAGVAPGLFIAWTASQSLHALIPSGLAGVTSIQLNGRMLAFATALAVICSLVFGLWPAWGSAKADSNSTIKNGGGLGATSGSSGRVRRALVGAELALTVVLLTGAGIMARSFEKIVDRQTGVQTENVGTMEIAFSMGIPMSERARLLDAITSRLTETPGMNAAGASKTLPFSTAGQLLVGIKVDGVDNESIDYRTLPMTFEDASPGYFTTLGISLLQGRLFASTDDAQSPRVAIVNATLARTYWPNGDAVGHTFQMSRDTAHITVIGVVADVPNRLDDLPTMQVYHPLSVSSPFVATVLARGTMPSAVLLRRMRDAVYAVNPSQPVFNQRMMDDVRQTSIAPRRTSTLFVVLFAILALVLSSVGVYAVISYSVSQRSRELGIRSALGAAGSDLVRLISGEMLWVTVIGVVTGVGGAWAVTRVLESLVYGVDVHDLLTFAFVPIAMLLPVALATLVPARRTLRVNPADVMRAE